MDGQRRIATEASEDPVDWLGGLRIALASGRLERIQQGLRMPECILDVAGSEETAHAVIGAIRMLDFEELRRWLDDPVHPRYPPLSEDEAWTQVVFLSTLSFDHFLGEFEKMIAFYEAGNSRRQRKRARGRMHNPDTPR